MSAMNDEDDTQILRQHWCRGGLLTNVTLPRAKNRLTFTSRQRKKRYLGRMTRTDALNHKKSACSDARRRISIFQQAAGSARRIAGRFMEIVFGRAVDDDRLKCVASPLSDDASLSSPHALTDGSTESSQTEDRFAAATPTDGDCELHITYWNTTVRCNAQPKSTSQRRQCEAAHKDEQLEFQQPYHDPTTPCMDLLKAPSPLFGSSFTTRSLSPCPRNPEEPSVNPDEEGDDDVLVLSVEQYHAGLASAPTDPFLEADGASDDEDYDFMSTTFECAE